MMCWERLSDARERHARETRRVVALSGAEPDLSRPKMGDFGPCFFPKSPLGKRSSPVIFGPLSFLPKVMNVEFQALPNCLANLRIEVEPDAVTKKREEVTKQYTKFAKLPGFRAGKAPRSVVEKKFNSEIKDEVTKQVLTDATRQAITDKGLRVLSLSEVEDVV